jgi:hypothetical protein
MLCYWLCTFWWCTFRVLGTYTQWHSVLSKNTWIFSNTAVRISYLAWEATSSPFSVRCCAYRSVSAQLSHVSRFSGCMWPTHNVWWHWNSVEVVTSHNEQAVAIGAAACMDEIFWQGWNIHSSKLCPRAKQGMYFGLWICVIWYVPFQDGCHIVTFYYRCCCLLNVLLLRML